MAGDGSGQRDPLQRLIRRCRVVTLDDPRTGQTGTFTYSVLFSDELVTDGHVIVVRSIEEQEPCYWCGTYLTHYRWIRYDKTGPGRRVTGIDACCSHCKQEIQAMGQNASEDDLILACIKARGERTKDRRSFDSILAARAKAAGERREHHAELVRRALALLDHSSEPPAARRSSGSAAEDGELDDFITAALKENAAFIGASAEKA